MTKLRIKPKSTSFTDRCMIIMAMHLVDSEEWWPKGCKLIPQSAQITLR